MTPNIISSFFFLASLFPVFRSFSERPTPSKVRPAKFSGKISQKRANKEKHTEGVCVLQVFACYLLNLFLVSGGLTCSSTAQKPVTPCCEATADKLRLFFMPCLSQNQRTCYKSWQEKNSTCPPCLCRLFDLMKMEHLISFACFKCGHR